MENGLLGFTPLIPAPIARSISSSRSYSDWEQVNEDFAWLRANMPLAKAEPEGFDPFWVVTKHADIQEVGRQPQIFTNNDCNHPGRRHTLISQYGQQALLEAARRSGRTQVIRSLVTMDAPEHPIYRMLTFGDFAPKGIRGLEQDIRALARESIEEMAATGGECDFVKDVALAYPMRVILSLLGVLRSDEQMMLRLTQEFFNPQDKDLNKGGVEIEDSKAIPTAFETLEAYYTYFNVLTEGRRSQPTGDIASTIANSRINGALIDNWTATGYYITILTAGHDTTSSSMAGGVWALAERPELVARIKQDRSLIPALVEESIRWTTPIIHFMRTATQNYQLRGQSIAAGDWLMLSYVSGDRDEDVIARPDEFLVDRRKNPQIAFGFGAHVCLGQHLARMEMRIFFEELFDRLGSLELAGTPRRNSSLFVGGVKSVPIRFRFT